MEIVLRLKAYVILLLTLAEEQELSQNVLYVLDIDKNLLSVKQLLEKKLCCCVKR